MRGVIEIVSCDRCEVQGDAKNVLGFSVLIRGCTDASGNNAHECVDFDLCPKCRTWLLTKLLEEKNRTPGVEVYIKSLVKRAHTTEI
jgi:hypothetical protein